MTNTTRPENAASKVNRLERLLDAASWLNSTLELKELTKILLDIVRAEVPVDRVTAFRVDRDRNVVHSLVAQEVAEEITLEIGAGIVGRVAATGDTFDIPDVYADTRFDPEWDRILEYRTKDLLAMPIINRHGDVVGVLELVNRARPIDASDMAFLRGISIHVGLAVENAWLYQQSVAKERAERALVDLSDRLAHLERLAIMAQVLNGVVHEINNPLTIAMGHLALYQQELDGDPRGFHRLKEIEAAIQRTADVARKFVHFAEGQDREYQPFHVRTVLGQIIDLRTQEWKRLGINVTVDLQQTPAVYGHERQMQLVFLYLLLNAEEAVLRHPSDGSIQIRLCHDSVRQQVRIEIEDGGPGILPKEQQHVFQPFYTTKAAGKGTGLGLTTVRGIVERHRGRVWFDTTVGQGTTFKVELPESAVTAP